MTKKDYEFLLNTIAESDLSRLDKRHLVSMFSLKLMQRDDKFDPGKFYRFAQEIGLV